MANNTLINLAYEGLSTLAGLFGWPFFYWHLKSRGHGESFRPRLGLDLPGGVPPGQPRASGCTAISVGEILAALPLVRELQEFASPGPPSSSAPAPKPARPWLANIFCPWGPRSAIFPWIFPGRCSATWKGCSLIWSLPWNRRSGLIFLTWPGSAASSWPWPTPGFPSKASEDTLDIDAMPSELINNYDLIIAGHP